MWPGSNSLAGGTGRSVTAVTDVEPVAREIVVGAAQPASTSSAAAHAATTAAAFAMLIERTIPAPSGCRLGIGSDPLARRDPIGQFGERALGRGLVVVARELLSAERVDRGHHLIGGSTAGATRRGGAVAAEVEGLAESHGDRPHPGEPRPDGLDLLGADETDRHDLRPRRQREPRDPGASAVETAVERAGALGVEGECVARIEDLPAG